jgi:ATP-dependent Lon protease
MKGSILCFVGPPGTGKTSIGQSIARAMGRKFVRMSLGGVHDEAEIRGHRRTYIGTLPGRIIEGIQRAGSNNPVFMLDEIDKVGGDFRRDPAAALLELLEPEQNFSFADHYLGVPFDLSKVMFIATANVVHPIPAPLQDRMEVLPLSGYTEQEKLQIANRFLVPKQLEANGLTADALEFAEDAILDVIQGYTREAGLRNLERALGAICRKVARQAAAGGADKVHVATSDIESYLGNARFRSEVAAGVDAVWGSPRAWRGPLLGATSYSWNRLLCRVEVSSR